MKNRILAIVCIMGLVIGLAGCFFDTQTDKVVEYADNLQDAINEFEDSRKKAADDVNEVTQETIDELDEDKPDLRGVAKSWETEWNDVRSRFNRLESDFSSVASSSRSYFNQLEQLANEIGDASLKASEERKNEALKTSWTEAFKKASDDIDNLRRLISEGDDFHKVLLGASLREKLAQNIEDLKNISNRAQSLLKNLERVTIEGRKLTAN